MTSGGLEPGGLFKYYKIMNILGVSRKKRGIMAT
jgi:hypothetical protein